ncbi:hypothetical protein ACETAC_01035 [Aceticella autotrophica]|uniref:Thioesterase domain-containing protein n=1 Tax=Aceticella autotrophica TaxID=2755338 RepID=A0A975AW46_9THEO|nr:thioesterase domain-containing protein [Aceticella autotrophica]QSZ27540.1 hypothetical protein ACETAC_01035 [Aceticella autotrophica]
MCKNILFLIPYAVVNSSIYNELENELNKKLVNTEIIKVELKGHGQRKNEELYDSIDQASNEIINFIRRKQKGSKVYIYGHCLGAIIAYDIYSKVKEDKIFNIEKLFLGSVSMNSKKFNFDEFVDNYIKSNIEKLLNNEDIKISNEIIKQALKYSTPILYKEYRIIVEYLSSKKVTFDENIILINGKLDIWFDIDIIKNCVNGYEFSKQYFTSGGHFYLDTCCNELADILLSEIDD